MNALLTKRCAVALLGAMTLALTMGLLACGPIRAAIAPAAPMATEPLQLLAALNLLAAGSWGLLSAHRIGGTPERGGFEREPSSGDSPARLAWQLWFASTALSGLASMAWQTLPHDATLLLLAQLPTSATCVMLMCAFLAERVDPLWGRAPALLVALLLATASVSHWSVGQAVHGEGDLRGLLLLQLLPLLLIPSGALRLEGRYTSRNDWRIVLTLYTLALLAQAAGDRIAPWLGATPGQTLRQVLLTAAVAWLAQRAAAPAISPVVSSEGTSAREASTSLNTCG
ncbi:hypothetical protein OOT46_30180 [Aquabacterium sp. A7-Y]|uniref:hypothetical protein n=1 Tax=Aquabacterium sp. A7-Y TaxID=1349605 RepID=UPI00223CD701|nr:hypothetical protein [Aquabacterium sp. A7-Y]MCW7542066.1 hypothetical protein [Aquabacterium sp. A7-Y]